MIDWLFDKLIDWLVYYAGVSAAARLPPAAALHRAGVQPDKQHQLRGEVLQSGNTVLALIDWVINRLICWLGDWLIVCWSTAKQTKSTLLLIKFFIKTHS